MVANLPWERWNARSSSRSSTSPDTVPPGQHEGSTPRLTCRSRLIRPPVWVSIPVSMSVTFQSSYLLPIEHAHLAVADIDRQVSRQRAVVDHPTLYDFALVTQGDDKVAMTVVGIVFHDVPQNRVATNVDHRFGAYFGFFGQARAEASG